MRFPICPEILFIVCLSLTLFACSSPEERAEAARAALVEALERGNRSAGLAAVDELQANLPDTPEALLEIAGHRVAAGDAPASAWMLERGIRLYPNRNDLRLAVGRLGLVLGNPKLTLDTLSPIGPSDQEHLAAMILSAQAELSLGNLDEALETLARAQTQYPEKPEARLTLISVLMSERRHGEARDAIEKARVSLPFESEEPDVLWLRNRLEVASVLLQGLQGDVEVSVAALREILEREPGDLYTWQAYVSFLHKIERTQDALPVIQKVLRSETPPVELFRIAAGVYDSLDDHDEAESSLREYASRSEDAAAYIPLVDYFSKRGELESALAALEEGARRYPEVSTHRYIQCDLLISLDRRDAALRAHAAFVQSTFDGDPRIRYLDARLLLDDGDAKTARDILRAIAPELDVAPTQYWLGRALEENGDVEGARRRYSLAKLRDPQWAAPAAALLELAAKRADWQAVSQRARELIELVPQEAVAWELLVESFTKLGKGETALQAANQCTEINPENAKCLLLVAKAQRSLGRHSLAMDSIETAERLDPSLDVSVHRVISLGMAGQVAEGIAEARIELSRDAEDPEMHAALASLLFAAGAANEGSAATDQALKLAPEDPRPLRGRCQFNASRGAWSKARGDCEQYLAMRPEDAGAHFMLGVALAQLGDSGEAETAYRRAAALNESDTRSRNNLADLLARQGKIDAALAAAQEAFQIEETNPYVMDTLGMLYLRKGLAKRAVSLLEDARDGLPKIPEVTLHLALAYRDAGRSAEARGLLVELQEKTSPQLKGQVDEALDSL